MNVSMLIGLACASTAIAQGPAFPTPIEIESEATASAWIDTLPSPLFDSDTVFVDELPRWDAEAEAEIEGDFGRNPRAESSVGISGDAIRANIYDLDVDLRFSTDDWDTIGTPRDRLLEGSWSQRLVFDLDERTRLEIYIRTPRFDEAELLSLEPGKLTGPDGVIVSGPPEPGMTTWAWVIELDPGRYEFETFGSAELALEGGDRAFDTGTHGVNMRFFRPRCRPDLDGDGELTIFDFLSFQNLFDAGDLLADFDDDGELTLFDFLAFQNAFDAGCD